MRDENLLIVFVKNRIAGQVKTRLAAEIGPEKAMKTYNLLLNHTCSVVASLDTGKEVWYSDSIVKEDEWTRSGIEKRVQPAGDLGDRMSSAFHAGFEKGFKKIVIIGSDCLQIRKDHIEHAFLLLGDTDLVIGPAADGGYYLLGMRHWYPEVFINKSWSQPSLFSETLQTAEKGKISFSELEMLNDIDTMADLTASNLWPDKL